MSRKRKTAGGPLDVVPGSMEELRAWLARWLGVTVPSAVMPRDEEESFDGGDEHLAAPMRYVWHAFDEEAEGPRDCVVWASRGGGKTFLGAVATVLDMVFKPGIEVRVLGGSLEQSRRMHEHVRKLLETPWLAELVDGKVSEKRVRLVNGSGVEILAASQTAIRGTRVQKVRCDEVELFDPELWTAAQLTTRSKTVVRPDGKKLRVRGSIEALSTMHVPFGLMWSVVQGGGVARFSEPGIGGPKTSAHARLGEPSYPKRRVFRWGTLDVLEKCGESHRCAQGQDDQCSLWPECRGRAKRKTPEQTGHVSVEDALVMKGRVDAASWASEMLSLKPRRSDCVYPEFDERTHVTDEDPLGEGAWVAGMDFGFRAPTVAVLAWVREEKGQTKIVVVQEHTATRTRLDEHLRLMREKGWPISSGSDAPMWAGETPAPPKTSTPHAAETLRWIGIDPAGEAGHEQTGSSNAALLRREGLKVRSRRVGLREGIGKVRALLAPADGKGPRLLVHRRCVGLIQALTRYHYPSDKPGSMEPEKDGPDHACDALRYMVINLEGGKGKAWKY